MAVANRGAHGTLRRTGCKRGKRVPRFAANLSTMFKEWDFLDRFQAAADAGFKAVECQFPYAWPAETIRRRLKESGLAMVLINMPPGDLEAGERGFGGLPGREPAFREALERAVAYARVLECGQIHAMAGVAPPDEPRERCMETFAGNLRLAAETCAAEGLRVLVEPINDRDVPGYLLNRPAQALAVIKTVGAGNLLLQYDLYHAQIMEGRLAETIEANLDVIGHVQIAGVPGRHEPVAGDIGFPALFDLFDRLGYDGWIGCEYTPRAGTLEGLAWARDYGIG